ncbi:MAG: hypothetical protein ABIN95_10435 [Mucilaginibacter sp.]
MDQNAFSEYVITALRERFPKLINFKIFDSGEAFIDYSSPNGKITLRISTQAKEITIGFAKDEKFGWHIHMNMFEANTPTEEIAAAIKVIDGIISNKETIIFSSLLGYAVSDEEEVKEYQQPDEVIEKCYWNEL